MTCHLMTIANPGVGLEALYKAQNCVKNNVQIRRLMTKSDKLFGSSAQLKLTSPPMLNFCFVSGARLVLLMPGVSSSLGNSPTIYYTY